MSSFDYKSSYDQPPTDQTDKELQTFIQTMQQRAEFQGHINHLSSICWDKCASGYPGSKLESKKSTCLENCTERYIDVSMFLRNRFQSMLSQLQQ